MNDNRIHTEKPWPEPGMPVPLVDEPENSRVYEPRILRLAVLFAVAGAALFGWLGYALASGAVTVGGLGQWASAGDGPAAFAGASLGAAAGGLTGALVALYRIPPRPKKQHHQEPSS